MKSLLRMIGGLWLVPAVILVWAIALNPGSNAGMGEGGFGGSTPVLDLNFVAANGALDSRITFTRASAATCRNEGGVRYDLSSNEPCFDHDSSGNALGLRIEETRINYFFNSEAPVTQTSPSLATGAYVCWIEGTGSLTTSENTGTATGEGVATEGSYDSFTVTGAGTFDFTIAGSVEVAQCEKGTFPSSLIVTAGATATRANDVAKMNDISFFPQSGGTIVAEWTVPHNSPDGGSGSTIQTVVNINTSGTGDYELRRISSKMKFTAAGAAAAPGDANSVGDWSESNTLNVAAMRYALNDLAGSLNGATSVTDSTVGPLPSPNRLAFGSNDGSSRFLFGSIKRLRIYRSLQPNIFLEAQ